MQKTDPLVSIIIVNYNGKHFLKEGLDSLFAMDYPREKLEIILVDNGSTDGSTEFLRKSYPEVKVLQNETNNYCRANNLGIKASGGEYVALLNNDVKVDPKWLAEIIKAFSADNRIGAITGKVLFFDGKLQGAGHDELPDFYWSDRGFLEEDAGQYEKTEEMESISHCAVVYRKACLDAIGPLDEDFNMFVEDVDMALRARQKGWTLLYAPGGRVFHKFHGTAQKDMVDFYCERNRLLLVAKHYPAKLAEALFGKGYFAASNNKNNLFKVLPEVLRKLITTNDAKTVSSLWPSFFESLNKITSIEREHLAQQIRTLNAVLSDKNELLLQKEQQLHGLNQTLAQKDRQFFQQERAFQDEKQRAEKLKQMIHDQKLRLTEALDCIAVLEERAARLEGDRQALQKSIDAFYASKTFLFFVGPLWKVSDFIKDAWNVVFGHAAFPKDGTDTRSVVLFIKPQRVLIGEMGKVIRAFKITEPDAKVVLLANLTAEDHADVSSERFSFIDIRLLYTPRFKKFSFPEQLKLLIALRRMGIAQVIILRGDGDYAGYQRAEWFARLVGAKSVKEVKACDLAPSAPPKRAMIHCWAGAMRQGPKILMNLLVLAGVVIFFLVFIVGGMQIRKILCRFRNGRSHENMPSV